MALSQANSTAIGQGIVSILQGLQYNGAPMYNLVKFGAVQDPTDVIRYASITRKDRITKRFDSGWKVNSTPVFEIETGVDMTDTTQAETQANDIADALTAYFLSHISLVNVQGVYVTLTNMNDQMAYKAYPSGRVYRVSLVYVEAVQQYNVQVQP